jgi:uncharacterized membrane protein
MRFARIFFVIILVGSVFETARLWSVAPAEMASHFNATGNPDNFVPKFQFFSRQVQTGLMVIGLNLLTQVLLLFLPVELINMPNREYWLAPERREATVDRLSSFVAALFTITLLAMQAGLELSVSANLQKPIIFAAQLMIPVIIGAFALSFMLLFWLSRSFRLPS